jgi:hypothetical protein
MNRLHGWLAFAGFAMTTAACAVTPSSGEDTQQDQDAYTIADGVVMQPHGVMRTVQAYQARAEAHVQGAKPIVSAPAGAQLTDHGGKVMAGGVKYTNVYWGSYFAGAGASEVTTVDGFMKTVGTSPDFNSVLAQYSKAGMSIDPASFEGHKVITTDPASTIDDTAIQSQIQAWIDDGTLPAPTGQEIYGLIFPPNVSITLQGSGSCTAFCGYHMTFNSTSGQPVRYMVIPHLDCAGCGFQSTEMDSKTVVLSHEMSEATTDPDVGLAIATNNNAYLGWYDDTNGEIGDICAGDPDSTMFGYAVQTEWSNADGACVATRTTQSSPDYSLAAAPTGAGNGAGNPGTRVRYKVTSTATGGFTGAIKLWVKGLPAGAHSSFSSALSGSGTTILRVTTSTTTPPGTYTLTIDSSSGSLKHSVPVTLTVN